MFRLFKANNPAPATVSGRCAEDVMPLVVAGLGKYADDCLSLSFAMIRGQAETPKLDVIDFQQIETLRQWLEVAPEDAQQATKAVVQAYQAQSMRFKGWIVRYNESRKETYVGMTQAERDQALAHDTGGAVRATLELRRTIETLWGHVTPNMQATPDTEAWLHSKFLYCNEPPDTWPSSMAYFAETLEF